MVFNWIETWETERTSQGTLPECRTKKYRVAKYERKVKRHGGSSKIFQYMYNRCSEGGKTKEEVKEF